MIGSIIGDIIGSVLEYSGTKTKDFPLFAKNNCFTDDSILTMAVFSALEKCNGNYENLSEYTSIELLLWFKQYKNPIGDYGGSFREWAETSWQIDKIQPPYNSLGNGSAMRVSPVAYFARSLEECKELAYKVTAITHSHPEGIKGSEATAVAIYMALQGSSKKEISDYIVDNYYRLEKSCDEIRITYRFDPTCQGTVPESIQAFLEAKDYEDSIRTTISLGGDADTMGAITGAIAEAYFGIPTEIEEKLNYYLDDFCATTIARMIKKRNDIMIVNKVICRRQNMAEFKGTFSDFKKFLGGYCRNKVLTITRPHKPKNQECQYHNCKAKAELQAAHVKGEERVEIMKRILDTNFTSQRENEYIVNLNRFEELFTAAHFPIEKHFFFLCQKCHNKYDRGEITIDPIESRPSFPISQLAHVPNLSPTSSLMIDNNYCKRPNESMQDYVKRLLEILYSKGYLTQEVLAFLQDKAYCKRTFDIAHALLESNSQKIKIEGHNRYWVKFKLAGKYYVCSQWWKDNFETYETLLRKWIYEITSKK